MKLDHFTRRAALTLGVLGLAGSLGACNDMLKVSNPGAIPEVTVEDPKLVTEMVNSAVGEFTRMYSDMAYWSAILTDEAVTGHNYWQHQHIDRRIMDERNSAVSDVYSPIQRARALGDTLTVHVKEHLGAAAASDVGLARALAYTGYSYTLLGEFFCYAPVDPKSPAITSDEILTRAVAYFEESVKIGTAAKTAAQAKLAAAKTKADSTAAKDAIDAVDKVVNLAHVGAARAALNAGNLPKAIEHAQPVPQNFVTWVGHSEDKTFLENPFVGMTTGSNRYLGVDKAFRDLNDPRVRYNPTSGKGHNQLTVLYTPYQSSTFGEWTKDGANQAFKKTTKHLLASGLEARYVLAEAGGLTEADVLAFVNQRRAVGNQAPVALAGDALKAELRDQRRRDFFLDGHRLGDLRRYIKLYNIDQFPSGPHPNKEWENYGNATCFVPHYSERVGNKEYKPLK
jgi:hypothetical protein